MIVELFGPARELARSGCVDLDLAEPLALRDVLGALAAACPALLGTILDRATFAPIEPNLILLDGRRAADLDTAIVASDRPCLLALPSGG